LLNRSKANTYCGFIFTGAEWGAEQEFEVQDFIEFPPTILYAIEHANSHPCWHNRNIFLNLLQSFMLTHALHFFNITILLKGTVTRSFALL